MLTVSIILAVRRPTATLAKRYPQSPGGPGHPPPHPVQPFTAPAYPYPPMNQGVRTELLKTLENLHASGALTDEQFEAEKRRISSA